MATIEKRFSKNGKSSYRVKIRMKGSPILSETFPNLTMARDWAAKTETRIKEGMNFSVLESRKHTLAELIDKYESSVLPNKHNASAVDTARHLHEWHRRIGYCYLANLTPALINKTRAEIADTPTRTGNPKSNSTINRYLAALSVVLSYADYSDKSARPKQYADDIMAKKAYSSDVIKYTTKEIKINGDRITDNLITDVDLFS